MNKTILFSILFALCSVSTQTFAENTSAPARNFGLVHEAQLSPALTQAADSIFLIVTVPRFDIVSKANWPYAVQRFAPHRNAEQMQIIAYYETFCQEGHACYFPVDFVDGSSFIAGDREGKQLWTNAHAALPGIYGSHADVTRIHQAANRGGYPVDFFLFNQRREMVANPTTNHGRLRIVPSQREITINVTNQHGISYSEDYVMIQLDHSLGRPLRIAAGDDIQTRGRMVVLGYPGYPASILNPAPPPAPGTPVVVPLMNMDLYYTFGRFGETNPEQSLGHASDGAFFSGEMVFPSDQLSGPGFSGSPVLNLHGEVMAIVFAHSNYLQRFNSLSVRPAPWR